MVANNILEKFKKSNLFKRTISGLLLSIVALFVVFEGGHLFTASIVIIFFLVWFEAYRIIKKAVLSGGPYIMWNMMSFIYSILPALSILYLYNIPYIGRNIIIWLFAIVWATDIGGYFIGIAIGGAKLCASVSPSKTWAGFLGGIIFAVIVNSILRNKFVEFYFFNTLIVIMASIVSQIGDLLQSSFKRHFKVKDSSNLIPGHGGVMDRLDGLILTSLFLAICFLGTI